MQLQLICILVFAYANCWFSHAKAQINFATPDALALKKKLMLVKMGKSSPHKMCGKIELSCKKTNNMHKRKQRCRLAVQRLCFRFSDSSTTVLLKSEFSMLIALCQTWSENQDCWFSHAKAMVSLNMHHICPGSS